ncbi:FadR family transcriptional regulator [Halobacillus shinanisalinarum]|uniref:FadR family transcriptional regulator n=1 Tax=Halobacillus shinanisalinarum TaxID=2932258 RepID=A0ABY4GWC3_9BACI|nr:FadR/GntR family transcriptional regulator [Halobacillus shinanisalinarum]UOQ92458.1 FadR family transcriptional regulator [Halobacillus shinanisalinarum]
MLSNVGKKRIYHGIVHQIKETIKKGEVLPGGKMPSERTLASTLAVSRTSIKEAYSVLESAGIVEIRQGSGVYLLKNDTEDIISKLNAIIRGQTVDMVELMELRQAVEVDIAYYAALRREQQDIEQLDRAFHQLEKAVSKKSLAAEEDLAFHMLIAKAARNRVIAQVMNMVSDQVLVGLEDSRAQSLAVPGKSQEILEEHRNIYKAVRDGSPHLAGKAMREHLQNVKQRYL